MHYVELRYQLHKKKFTNFPYYMNNQQNALQCLRCTSLTKSSPTCFGRFWGHPKGDFITKIQRYKYG